MSISYATLIDFSSAGSSATLAQGSVTYTAGDEPVVWVDSANTTATISVSDDLGGGPNNYTQVGSTVVSGHGHASALFVRNSVGGGGTCTVTVTWSAAATNRCASVYRAVGSTNAAAQAGNGQNQNTAGTGTDAVTTGNMTPTGQPNGVFGVTNTCSSGAALSAGTGFTSLGAINSYTTLQGLTSLAEWKRTTSTAAVAATMTEGTADDTNIVGLILGEAVAPTPDFVGVPRTGPAVLSVTFTDLSAGGPTSWLWEKQTGGAGWASFSGTPAAQNPIESFTVGQWDVRMTATNSVGSNTSTKTVYVDVNPYRSIDLRVLGMVHNVVPVRVGP